ncbi:MAG: Insulinase (Peptidase M16) [Sclerophora amabilis]|nr:MAG: Insulinase (Peptidase M16) [Sclerophora amabilis]
MGNFSRAPGLGTAERLADRLETPSLDDRSYRVIRLPNKLEALLVHDPNTDKASAALDVNVGNFSDREDMPGMAHAVEHLLFMGTEKYPKENAYSQYLASHNGYSNAYTASTSTNYYFEVSASSNAANSSSPADASTLEQSSPLYGALDRFAQFFIKPLFLSSTLDRELNAVDSENKKNLQSDTWRLHQLDKSLSNPDHPYCHFSTGNLQTLRDDPRERGVEVRSEFIKFHEEHYSANRMKLVVLGLESLDQLESWVVELFPGVCNKDLPQNRWDGVQPFTPKELLTQRFAKPVMESRSLEISFPSLDEEELFESQPSRYISHLVGHEGPGSILAYIKAKGWANDLSAGNMPICPGSAVFVISIKLTEDGCKNYEEIVKVVFQYISLIRETTPQEWIVEEMKGMAEVDFRFKQKSPASKFTSRISSVMQNPLPREWLLSGSSLIRKYDPQLINKALDYFKPDNFRLAIVSPDFSDGLDQKERWYGTQYKYEKIPSDFLAAVEQAGRSTAETRLPDLYMPHKNEFIPTKLEVEKKEVNHPLKNPKLIRNDEGVRLWWKKDDQFWVPKGNVFITLRSPLVYTTPQNVARTTLYCELVKDALVEYSYDAELAGLDYALSNHSVGLDVDVSGYNDRMPVLLEKVLTQMRDLEVKHDRFKVIKDRLLRGHRNWDFQQPYYQVGEFTKWLNTENGWINEQLLADLPHTTLEDVRDFYPQILRQMHIEMLVHGNLYKEDALQLTQLVESILKPRPLPQSQWNIRRSLILPSGSNYIYPRTLKDPANVNHCIEYFLYVGDNADRALRAKLLLFAQTTDEASFNQLRTKEQLGYVVSTGPRLTSTTMGYRALIQSEKPTEHLETRIDAFLTSFGQELKDMPSEEFEGHKRSLINKRLEKLKNLGQESRRFWTHIASEYMDFEQVEHDAAHIASISQNDLVQFFSHYIDPSSPSRSKLSVHMIAQALSTPVATNATPAEQKEQFLLLINQYLDSEGVKGNSEKLQERFKDVDITQGDQAVTLDAISKYLAEDIKLDAEKTSLIVGQGVTLLSVVLPSLGIAIPSTRQEELADSSDTSRIKEAITIEDVHAFKAKLAVSRGAIPVKQLSDFEDLEPKL